jgi:hypothetical protein
LFIQFLIGIKHMYNQMLAGLGLATWNDGAAQSHKTTRLLTQLRRREKLVNIGTH